MDEEDYFYASPTRHWLMMMTVIIIFFKLSNFISCLKIPISLCFTIRPGSSGLLLAYIYSWHAHFTNLVRKLIVCGAYERNYNFRPFICIFEVIFFLFSHLGRGHSPIAPLCSLATTLDGPIKWNCDFELFCKIRIKRKISLCTSIDRRRRWLLYHKIRAILQAHRF